MKEMIMLFSMEGFVLCILLLAILVNKDDIFGHAPPPEENSPQPERREEYSQEEMDEIIDEMEDAAEDMNSPLHLGRRHRRR